MADEPKALWTDEALKTVERAPFFLRGMVKRLAEKKAREQGIERITPEQLTRWKNEAMGGLGGEKGLRDAADQMQKGHLPWTLAARERLATVPEFMRGMVRQIAEEIAMERGHMEVNVELLEKVEALGELDEGKPHEEMHWTPEAMAMVFKKIENAPSIAEEFVFQMIKRDAEELARARGMTEMTKQALKELWESPKEEVQWSEEAWNRLQTSPDFVRSGIKKAAERRARKDGAKTISSEMLTRYRNQAMMKAVMRIRKLGFNELTFDAFEAAKQKVKRLQGNEQADKRLDEIKDFMIHKREAHQGDVLGEELMTRFRKYLKGEGDLKVNE
jgi:hypothetical protein